MALMPVAEALRLVLIEAKPLPIETVALDQARGRVLAEEQRAEAAQTAFHAALTNLSNTVDETHPMLIRARELAR